MSVSPTSLNLTIPLIVEITTPAISAYVRNKKLTTTPRLSDHDKSSGIGIHFDVIA